MSQELTAIIGIGTSGFLAAIALATFMWKIYAWSKKQSDEAHATIGTNISKVDGKIDRLAEDVSGIKTDVAVAKNDIGWIKDSAIAATKS